MNSCFGRNELVKWLKLSSVRGLGPKRLLHIFNRFESVEELFLASPEELLKTRVFTHEMIKEFGELKNSSDDKYFESMDFCAKEGIKIIPLVSEEYPARLLEISAAPCTLFLWGDESLLHVPKSFAIVGARKANEAAHKFAYDSAKTLANAGVVIVSGGAEGIDSDAHAGALDADGKTIAVMGTGFSHFYPQENVGLFNEIRRKGLLVSEHTPDFYGNRFSFLQRNRITSGLSDALLFCACESLKSGTSTQVKIALTQKKPVYCPSPELNALPNAGIQEAIINHKAKPIHNANEILKQIKTQNPIQQPLQAFEGIAYA